MMYPGTPPILRKNNMECRVLYAYEKSNMLFELKLLIYVFGRI